MRSVASHATMSACQPPTEVPAPCSTASEALWARSYPLPRHWPFGAIRLVMETAPGSCDLYQQEQPSYCCKLTRRTGEAEAIEGFVREVIASLLGECRRRACRAIDVGANIGWMTAYMLDLGASVVSVEPQPDLAAALRETAALNCWSDRSVVLNHFACACGRTQANCFAPGKWNARCLREQRIPARRAETLYRAASGIPVRAVAAWPPISGIGIDDVVFHGADSRSAPWHVDLLKLDGDGPEIRWLQAVSRLLRAHRALTIDAITVEFSTAMFGANENLKAGRTSEFAEAFKDLQSVHGYDFFRLDTNDFRRLMTGTGWDAFSDRGAIGRIDRVRGPLPRDALEDEILGLRAMRHLWRIKRNLTHSQWHQVLAPLHKKQPVLEFLLVHGRVAKARQ